MEKIKKALSFLDTNSIHYILAGSVAIAKEYEGFIKERRPDGIGDLDIILDVNNFAKLLKLDGIESVDKFDMYDAMSKIEFFNFFYKDTKTEKELEGSYFLTKIKDIDLKIDIFLNSNAFIRLKEEGKDSRPIKEIIQKKIEISKDYIDHVLYEGDKKLAKKIIKHLDDIFYISSIKKT